MPTQTSASHQSTTRTRVTTYIPSSIKSSGGSLCDLLWSKHLERSDGAFAGANTRRDRAKRAREMKDLGVDMVELHAGLDEQAAKTYKIDDLIEIAHEIELSFAIAGGVNEASIVQVQTSGAEVAVVGGAILQCAESFGECTRLTKLDSGATQ